MVDAACPQALDDGVHSYRHVKAITERLVAEALQRMDSDSSAPATVTTQSHDLIRSPQEYGELFAMAAASTPPSRSLRMNTNEIEITLRKLRLSGMAETLQTRVLQAQDAQEPFMDTLAALLQDALDRRKSRLMARRFKLSGLDERLQLADFDCRFNPKLPRAACFELHTLKFIGEGANALIVGKPGTGKSHIAKAVAYQATLQGYNVC